MKKEDILLRIESKEDNCYRTIVKEYLKSYIQFNNFEKSIFLEVICLLIEKCCSTQQCFLEISKEYNINCKKIIFWAIIPLINMKTIKSKFLFFTHMDDVISQCLNLMKNQVIKEIFK